MKETLWPKKGVGKDFDVFLSRTLLVILQLIKNYIEHHVDVELSLKI